MYQNSQFSISLYVTTLRKKSENLFILIVNIFFNLA